MPSANARLVVEIAATSAQFREDMGKAAAIAQQQAKRIENSIVGIQKQFKNIIGGIALGATVEKFSSLIKAAIDGADKLNDLSKTTGIAVTTLGGIGFAAEQAGSSLDGIVGPIGKLNLEIAKAAQGNPDASATFSALGINVRGANKEIKDAGQVLVELAGKFETYKDGPNKAAIANALFKKGFAELVPLLNEGSAALQNNIAYYQKYSGMTTEVAERSDKFNDELAKAKLLTAGFFRNIAADLLPALTGYVQAMSGASESHHGFREQSAKTAESIKLLAEWAYRGATAFQFFGEALGARAAQAAAFLSGEFSRASKIGDLLNADFEKFKKDQEAFLAKVNNPSADTGPKKPRNLISAPGLPEKGSDAAKKLLDAQIRAFEDSIREEQQLLTAREHFLEAYYQDDEINLRDFFGQRQAVLDSALQKQLEAIDGEIEALRKFASTRSGDDRIKAESDLAEAIRKRGDIQRQVALKSVDLFFEERKAVKGFKEDLEQASIRLLELSGDKVSAALASFDFSRRRDKIRIDLEINSPDAEIRRIAGLAKDAFEAERNQVSVQAQLTDATQRFGDEIERVGLAQSRIDIQRSSGALTELEALRATGNANEARIAQLRQIADEYQRIADNASDPRFQLAADQLRLKIEQLAASTDLVAKKFNDVFVDAFSSALEKITEKGAKFSDIIKALEKDLVAGISRIASRNIAETLFKPENFGGVGKFFGDLFGGGKAKTPDLGGASLSAAGTTLTSSGTTLTSAGTVLTSSGTTLTSAGTLLTSAGASLNAAAASLSAASASLSASSIGGGLGGLGGGGFGSPGIGSDVFSFFGFAKGTDFAPGGVAVVGEKGPELVYLPRGAQVIPNDRIGKLASGTDNWPGGFSWVGERGRELVNMTPGTTQVLPNDLLRMRGYDDRPQSTSSRVTNMSVTNNINIAGSASTRTANQTGLEVGRRVRYAAMRIG